MGNSQRDFDRLLALATGAVQCADDEDASDLIAEEERLTEALVRAPGGLDQAARKLRILAARLRADGHGDCEEGRRNLALLDSAIADLQLAVS